MWDKGIYHGQPQERQNSIKQESLRRSSVPFESPWKAPASCGWLLVTQQNHHEKQDPTPRSDEIFDILGGSQFFTKIDLKTGFHQIRVKPEDVEKTAFQTKYGQYEYLVLPMGLCNATATFATMMNEVRDGLVDRFCTVYLDDIFIFSKTAEEHRLHVKEILQRLRDHKLYASPEECHFMAREVEFLGIIVGTKD